MKRVWHKAYLFNFCLFLVACSATKHIPEGDKLYTGARIKLEGTTDLTRNEHKVLKSDLGGLTRPKPNSRFLGMPLKLSLYNFFYKKEKLRNKLGEPPDLLSDVDLQYNSKILQNHSENKGFFKASVSGDTVVKRKKAHAVYTVEAGNQYLINSVAFENDSSDLARAIQGSVAKSILKVGEPYDLDVIKGERLRIDAFLKENGFYYFGPDYLIMKVDSTSGNNTVDIRVSTKPETPDDAKQAYRINDVFIYSGYNVNTANIDTSKNDMEFYKGYYIVDRRKRYKPRLFAQAMRFDPGDIYNRTDHNLTLNRLINLDQFKFVKNRFEKLTDSAKLNAYYYLTPMPKQSLRGEITATTKSNNSNGTQLTLTWANRNRLRGGERLSVSAYAGAEVQFGGSWKGYNTYRSGAEINLTVPRFFVPGFPKLNTRSGFVPRSNIQLGYDVLRRQKLYTLNSYRGGLGYLWKESFQKQHEFYPISVNYVQPSNITKEYLDSAIKYPYLLRSIDSQFIIGSTYQYSLNQIINGITKRNSFYFNGIIDLSGFLAGLFTKKGADDQKRIMDAAFNQYVKLEADFRYYRKFGLKSAWANRIITGYGIPYGNSQYLPYIKQFFIGGNNSLRAFRSRTVGPGTYPLLATTESFPDQTGDIKLEINTEYRPHISGPLYGALFLEAGNIWLANEDPDRPGAKFSKDFLKELAVGGGFGVRFDITLFIIRFDIGIPLRQPWKENPWLLSQIELGEKEWRRENIMYNLAIGYPF